MVICKGQVHKQTVQMLVQLVWMGVKRISRKIE